MAYKKRAASYTRKRTSGYSSRKSSAPRRKSGGAKRSARTVQTLRIVVEQPQAVSSVVPQATRTPTKARF